MDNKKTKDTIGIKGEVELVLYDERGNVKTRRKINNLVVQSGKNLIAGVFHGSGSGTITHVGVGTGNTPPDLAQTALVTEIPGRRPVGTPVLGTSPATITYSVSYAAGQGTGTIGEAGMFTAATAGTMVARTAFTPIPKGANDVLGITWILIFG